MVRMMKRTTTNLFELGIERLGFKFELVLGDEDKVVYIAYSMCISYLALAYNFQTPLGTVGLYRV